MMHGRNKRSASHCTMALLVLGCTYFAITPLSALAQDAGGRGVSVTVNPTTGYSVINSNTVGVPRGTTVGPSGGVPSVTVGPAGGLSQSLPAGIEITGIQQNSQTLRGSLGAKINAGAGALRGAATRCLTSFRCNAGMALGSLGLQQLLDGVGWIMEEGSRPTAITHEINEDPDLRIWRAVMNGYRGYGPTELAACAEWTRITPGGQTWTYVSDGRCGSARDRYGPFLYRENDCPSGTSYIESEKACGTLGSPTPLTDTQISDAVISWYDPHVSDWNWLTGGLDLSDPDVTIEVTELPILDGSNEPNFIEWSDGTSRGTFNIYTPTVRGNNTSRPEIDIKEQQIETSYDNQGNPTGSSTSTTNTPSSMPTGDTATLDLEVPTDCEFMPTICRFLEWFKEPDDSPDPDQEIRDLVQVYEDGGRDVSVGSDTGSCPAPRTIQLSLVPPVEFSFQPFCDLATAVRFWLLALASFGAAYMTVRSI